MNEHIYDYLHLREMDKIANLNGKRILDVGCGRGGLCRFILDCYDPTEVVGVDTLLWSSHNPDEIVCDDGKLKIIQADCEDLPFPDNYFDFALSIGAFEHFKNPQKILSEVKRVLKPGGGGALPHSQEHGTGRFYIAFHPLYTSCSGHHFGYRFHEIGRHVFSLIPPWGHLYMSKEEMLQHLLAQNVDDELSNKIMERLYGYEREELNCLSRTEHLANFTKCGMRIIGIDELPTFNRFFRYFTGYNDKSSELTPGIIERVRNAGYSISDLGIVQITIVLEKYKNLP